MVRVLVADDDPVMSQLLCEIVKQRGWRPVPAFDAMQAGMFALREPRPHVILLDINMPGGTGITALKRLKSGLKTKHIPIIVVTGANDPNLPEIVRELGAARYVTKPVDPDTLVATIEHVLTPPA